MPAAFVIFFLGAAPLYGVQYEPSLVPENAIQQKDSGKAPYWKILWDEAREAARQGNYEKAERRYFMLLGQKKELNEARWEYSKVLLHLGKKEQGVAQLEILIEAVPNQPNYLNMLADILNEQSALKRAVEIYYRAYELEPNRDALFSGLSDTLIKLNRKEEALPFLEKLYDSKKTDTAVREDLAVIYYELGLFDKAANHLAVLAEASRVKDSILVMAANAMDKLGRKRSAIGYWQRVLERDPNNDMARKSLTAFYKNSGRVNDALAYFLALLEMTPKNPALLNQVGKIYVETGRLDEGLPYLERYAELMPNDRDALHNVVTITLKLANESLMKGELDKSRDYLARVTEIDSQGPNFLLGRAALQEKLRRTEHALNDYELFLRNEPDRKDIRLHVINLAGKIGDYETVRKHVTHLGAWLERPENVKAELVVAGALTNCGVFNGANEIYRRIIANKDFSKEIKVKALLEAARLFQVAGLPYESEQALRTALLLDSDSVEVLIGLFEHAIAYPGEVEDGGYWLTRLNMLINSSNQSQSYKSKLRIKNQLLRSRLMASWGSERAAIKICRRLLEKMETTDQKNSKAAHMPTSWGTEVFNDSTVQIDVVRIGLTLAGYYLAAGKLELAEEQLFKINTFKVEYELEYYVLLQLLYLKMEEYGIASEVFAQAKELAGWDLGTMIYLAELYRREHLLHEFLGITTLISQKWPESLKGRFLLAEALESNGQLTNALEAVAWIGDSFPNNLLACAKKAYLLHRLGRYEKSLLSCKTVTSNGGSITDRPDMQLLTARNLWALNRWDESIKIYKAYLSPPSVDDLFEQKIEGLGISSVKRTSKKTFFDYITFSSGKEVRLIEQALYAHKNDDEMKESATLHAAAIPFWAQYKWQEDFERELAARMAVRRREYMHAARKYEDIVERNPKEESLLFDMAGVYSRLGRLGDEASLYERISELNPDYPGLRDASARNRLKIRPRIFGGYSLGSEEGRDDYKDMKKEAQLTGVTFFPSVQHEIGVTVSRIRYHSTTQDRALHSNKAFLNYNVDFLGGFSLALGGGVETPDDDIPGTGLLKCAIVGSLGDKVTGRFSAERELVTDTIASFSRNITRETYRGGIEIDLHPRLSWGANYDYWDISDNNFTQGYDIWASYVLFQEPTFLKISYGYDFKDSGMGQNPGVPSPDGYAPDDHPYWAPKNYWQNTFTLFFKHLLSKDTLDRGVPRYYTLEYSPIYDSRGYGIQTLKSGFYMELTPNFLMELTGQITSSEVYRAKNLFFSIAYRW